MEIALIANDTKKELMTQFCIAYCGVLAKHNLCATKMTGRLISEATGLKIEHVLPGRQGGVQQISSRIEYNEIDAVVYFHDPADEFDEQRTDSDKHRYGGAYNNRNRSR